MKSRRVAPGRLLDAGFQFQYPTWPEAAQDLIYRWRHRFGGLSVKDVKYGDTTVNGDKATVSVTFTQTAMGQTNTQTQQVPVEKVNGEWKVSSGQGMNGLMGAPR